jgi:hypothetical protein
MDMMQREKMPQWLFGSPQSLAIADTAPYDIAQIC